MDRGAWWATVHGVAKSRTRLSNTTTTKDNNHWIHVVTRLGKSGIDTLKQLPSNQLPASTN